MLHRLTRPRWLLRSAIVIGLCVAFALLGRWQLHRGEATQGTIQNYGYAIEWPLFGVAVMFGWWKMLQDELYPEGKTGKVKRVSPWHVPEPRTSEEPGTTAAGSTSIPASVALSEELDSGPLDPFVTPAHAKLGALDDDRGGFPEPLTTAEIDPDDAEVIRYNEWLAQLSKAPVNGYRPKARR